MSNSRDTSRPAGMERALVLAALALPAAAVALRLSRSGSRGPPRALSSRSPATAFRDPLEPVPRWRVGVRRP